METGEYPLEIEMIQGFIGGLELRVKLLLATADDGQTASQWRLHGRLPPKGIQPAS